MKPHKIIEELKWLYEAIKDNGDENILPELRHPTTDEALLWAIDFIEAHSPSLPVNAVVRLPGCGICGGKLVKIRGKYPGGEKREVCPTCLKERLDHINEISSNNYGVAATDKAI